jgi:hypothetical protein
MAVDLQYFKIIAVLISPLALKTRSYELQPGGRWSFFVTFPPKAGISGEELEASELRAAYRPHYFVSGHDHAFSLHIWPKLEPENGAGLACSYRVNC